MQIIIYKNELDVITTLHRLDDSFTIMEIGYISVPHNVKFKILESDEYYSVVDDDFLEAFNYDFENNYDGVGMSEEEWESYKIENK